MIESHVAELRLHVRTDVRNAANIRLAAERLVHAALERCSDLLDERAPGRVVMIRRLPLRWRIEESVLDDDAYVEALAQAVADAIERRAVAATIEPPAAFHDAVLFDDEAHLRAFQLLAGARGRSTWLLDTLAREEPGEPLASLAVPSRRAVAQATLVRLARDGVLAEVLDARPNSAAALANALGPEPTAVVPAGHSREAAGDPAAALDGAAQGELPIVKLAEMASHWPVLDPAVRGLALRAHAAALLDVTFDSSDAIALGAAVSAPAARAGPDPARNRITGGRTTEAAVFAPAARAERNSDHMIGGRIAEKAKLEASVIAEPPRVPAAKIDRSEPVAVVSTVATRCAGLFYLLDRVQELDLAEALWKACLPEGAVLAAATAALMGPTFIGDAAPALFGGIDATSAFPDVSTEQHAEVATAICIALATALLRRGLAEIPPAVADVIDHPAGRLLVARAEGSPFAFFAWPVHAPDTVQRGLRAFLDGWSQRGALTASPALAALELKRPTSAAAECDAGTLHTSGTDYAGRSTARACHRRALRALRLARRRTRRRRHRSICGAISRPDWPRSPEPRTHGRDPRCGRYRPRYPARRARPRSWLAPLAAAHRALLVRGVVRGASTRVITIEADRHAPRTREIVD